MENKLHKLATLIEDHTKARFAKQYPEGIHNGLFKNDCMVKVIPGRKYTKIDIGSSGKYMVDNDGNIFGIKSYGVIHKGHQYGTLDTIDDFFWGEYTAIRLNKTTTPAILSTWEL